MGRVSLLDNFFANYPTKAKDKKVVVASFCKFFRGSDSNYLETTQDIQWIYNKFTRFSENYEYVNAADTLERDEVSMCIEPQVKNCERQWIAMPDTIENIKTDNTGHLIFHIPKNKRRRYRYCHNHMIALCKWCNIPLHEKCFEHFHK